MGMSVNPLQRAIGPFRAPIGILAAVGALLIFVPFIVLVSTSWTSSAFLNFPATGFSLEWYATVVSSADWIQPFLLSVLVAVIATAGAVILGVAGALGVSRVKSAGIARAIRTLFIVPIALPPVAYAVGLYGINFASDVLHGTMTTLIVGEVLLALPYVFVIVSGSVSHIDPALRPAASTLGARWPVIILRVELPIILSSIFAGALFAFSVVFDELVLPVFLLPPGVQTLPLRMFSASQESFSPELTAASTLVSLLALVILGLGTLLARRRAGAGARRALRRQATPGEGE